MKKISIWIAEMLAAALLLCGCMAGSGTSQEKAEKSETETETASETVAEPSVVVISEETDITEETVASESAEGQITPAATRQEALDLYDRAFTQHDLSYVEVAYIEPFAQEFMEFALAGYSEETLWDGYDEQQGGYYNIGVFEGYFSEITSETQITDTQAIEEELLQNYGYSCSIQEAYDVIYTKTAYGTEGNHVEEGFYAQMIRVDDNWYISKVN